MTDLRGSGGGPLGPLHQRVREEVVSVSAPTGSVANSMTGTPLIALAIVYVGDCILEVAKAVRDHADAVSR